MQQTAGLLRGILVFNHTDVTMKILPILKSRYEHRVVPVFQKSGSDDVTCCAVCCNAVCCGLLLLMAVDRNSSRESRQRQ